MNRLQINKRHEYNIYCDESCHLEVQNPEQNSMVLGALVCSKNKRRKIADDIRQIKINHGYDPEFEIKWVKVTILKMQFYLDLIDYFFDSSDLNFRAVVIPDKKILDHMKFLQTHDDWYYKMYYLLLEKLIDTTCSYNIFLDIKDSRSYDKTVKLLGYLRNKKRDWNNIVLSKIQHVRSHEVEQNQLVDLLIGAISYANRKLSGNRAKLEMVGKIESRYAHPLTMSTDVHERKLNILIWEPYKGSSR